MSSLNVARELLSELLLRADYILEDFQQLNRLIYSIDRLLRNGFPSQIILEILLKSDLSSVTPQMLPKQFWENSLLNPNAFYFHRSLRLTTPPRKFNSKTNSFEKQEPFYLEMRIVYTIEDALEYLYSTLHTPYMFRQPKRDRGALLHLLDKYSNLTIEKNKIESIDYILFLIDYTAKQEVAFQYFTLFDCENKYGTNALTEFIYYVTQNIASHHNVCKYKGI